MDNVIGREFFALAVAMSVLASTLFTMRLQDRVNTIRDIVLTGRLENGVHINADHRALLLSNDWLPYNLATILTTGSVAAILLAIPVLYGLETDLVLICAVGAFLPVLSVSSSAIFGFSEYRTLKAFLDALPPENAGP